MDKKTEEVPIRNDGITIPEAEIDLKLEYVGENYDNRAQKYVDAIRYGAYFMINDSPYISDHAYQEFFKLDRCKIGMTAYVYGKRYICYKVCDGLNLHDNLYYQNRTCIVPYEGIVIYTCRDETARNVLMTFWK